MTTTSQSNSTPGIGKAPVDDLDFIITTSTLKTVTQTVQDEGTTVRGVVPPKSTNQPRLQHDSSTVVTEETPETQPLEGIRKKVNRL